MSDEPMDPVGPVPAEEAESLPLEELRRSWQVRRRLVLLRRRLRQGLVLTVVLLVCAIGLISQTGRGQEFALRTALTKVQASLSGQLSIEGVRSGTLLTGATLTGVRLDASDGRPFMTADSVQVLYSIPAAIIGGRPIRSTVFWGLDLEISKYTSDQAMNVTRLLAEGEASANSQDSIPATASRPVSLGRVGIRESRVRVLSPASDRDGRGVVEGPDGEPLRQIELRALDMDVEEAVLATSSAMPFEARLASFSSEIVILDDPFIIDEVFADVSFGPRGIVLSNAQYRLPGGLLEGDVSIGPQSPADPWTLEGAFVSDGWMDLGAVQWIDPRIPDGRFRGEADVYVSDGVHLDLADVVDNPLFK